MPSRRCAHGSAGQDWTIGADGTIRTGGMCLDVLNQGTASKTPVDLGTCTGGASQRWTAAVGTFVNAASGKCLDDPRFVTADGTGLEIYACNAGANQLWSPKSWNLTTDFARHPTYNPAPDFYGDHGTWSFEYGTQGQQSSYALDIFDKTFNADCSVHNVFFWADGKLDPFVAYNSGPTIVGPCGGDDAETWTGDAVIVSPGAVTGVGDSVGVDSVIGWKSPMTGRVTVTATIQGANRFEQGITWELYEGGVDLTGPVTENADQLSAIGPLSVPAASGQSLYLEIGSGSNDGDFDDCTLAFTIEA